ncbi:hypothetical protein [Arsenicibacter rosenii]|uniref:Uncharacterized protein n=1 Tax=Arsenicibacter rosenii TaxID=1750698 RepID=A0A1S2VI15_9BACT|nr:hypothetical protein [Arsenicibacter rosenii]OIN58050.1 hypothetical protein BLX24_16095 [Arsenicibacter rosenii]
MFQKTIFLSLLVTRLAVAQTTDQIGGKAFEMTKATVEFLATDKKTYGYQTKESCPACVSYQTLNKFIADNKLTKADELVNAAQKKTAELTSQKKPDAEVLKELRSFLLERVTGGAERKHRLTLKSFAAYQNQLNTLAGLAPVEAAQPPVAETPVSDQEDQEVAPDTVAAEHSSATATSSTTETSFFSMSLFALIASLLSLAGVGLLFLRKPKQQETNASDQKIAEMSDQLFKLKGEYSAALRRIEALEKALSRQAVPQPSAPQPAASQPSAPQPVNAPVPPPAPRPEPARAGQNVPRTHTEPYGPPVNQPAAGLSTPEGAAIPPAMPASSAPAAPKPGIKSERYARTADLGDGFSMGGLLPAAERGTIYQLALEGHIGTYRIVENTESQQLALSDPYSYLSDACEYLNQPRANARIMTEKPGQVSLQGDKWKIEQKARVSFM